jgi:hypothetical protein
MYTVTSFRGSSVSGEELSGIVADYVALDRARVFRRLLMSAIESVAITEDLGQSTA